MPDFLVSFPKLNIIDLAVNRVAFEFNLFGRSISIYWYGILIAAGFLIAMILSLKQAKSFDLNPDHVSEMYMWIIPLGLIGARLYYVAFAWSEFAGNPAKIIDTRTGGLAFYGGVIGGVIGVMIWSRVRKIPMTKIADFLIVYLPLGQAIGRWGNFFNQEAFGTNTMLPWGMISNGTRAYLNQVRLPGVNPNLPVHPTFFYEFVANLLIFIVLLIIRRKSIRPLTTVSAYLIMYGIVRFFVEGIRTDPLYVGDGRIRVSQWLSAAMVVAGVIILLVMRQRRRQTLEASLSSVPESGEDDVEIIE